MSARSSVARTWARWRGRRYGLRTRLASGGFFWPLDPRAEEVSIVDVARGLANECRWGGQTSAELPAGVQFYSVAEHSVIVSRFVEHLCPQYSLALAWARQALLHDAAEAYVGDVIRPLKVLPEFAAYRKIESEIQRCVFWRFDVWPSRESSRLIREIDNRICTDERARMIAGDRADTMLPPLAALGCDIQMLSPALAERAFMQRYRELFR